MTRPVVMGIVNATPDSFSDGGSYDPVEHGRRLLGEGADWIDVGGESTRPGSVAVDVEEEWARVAPVVRAFATATTVSIDTSKPEVARRALAEGARVINDVTGLRDPQMAELSAQAWGTVVMHMRGTPATMRGLTDYDDVVAEVRLGLVQAARRARSEAVFIDPGIGFAKTAEQSARLLRETATFAATGFPVLVGASRKSFIGALLDLPDPGDRLVGSLAAAAAAYHGGARVFRVHDVAPTRQLVTMLHAIAHA